MLLVSNACKIFNKKTIVRTEKPSVYLRPSADRMRTTQRQEVVLVLLALLLFQGMLLKAAYLRSLYMLKMLIVQQTLTTAIMDSDVQETLRREMIAATYNQSVSQQHLAV